uniref:SAM domain-containing protein n=1 Tax=Ascaris lumbricoides TaxID=6252 RepID=A0A0M3IXE9_ASCLU
MAMCAYTLQIDDLGNPIEEQCNIPRRYNIGTTDINYQGGDEEESIHCTSNDPTANEDRSSSIDDKPRDVSDVKQRCKTLSRFENQVSPLAAMRKMLMDTRIQKLLVEIGYENEMNTISPSAAMRKMLMDIRIQKLLVEIGYENEMNTVLRWLESSHYCARRCSL